MDDKHIRRYLYRGAREMTCSASIGGGVQDYVIAYQEKMMRHITTVDYPWWPALHQSDAPYSDVFHHARHEREGRDHDIA